MTRRTRRCLGIDIGSTSVKVAELSQDRTGVTIHRTATAPLDVTPDTPAETRWVAVTQVLRDLLREHKMATRQAVFGLPGQAVFVRRVHLPRTTEERLHRIIRFEARQQIPFPLEQTLLQWQVFPSGPDEVEVLLVAIKRDVVTSFMALIRRLHLKPIGLAVNSFGLFNFHAYDQGMELDQVSLEGESRAQPTGAKAAGLGKLFGRKKKAKEQGPETEEPVPPSDELGPSSRLEAVKAYVSVGASTIDLAIGKAGGSPLGFIRSIPVAGNHLTRAIQERCGCETFAEAERKKREETQVGSSSESSRAIMPVVDRIVTEIRRSLDFYISQPDGTAVDSIVLSGGQCALPGFVGYIEERLGLPVEEGRPRRLAGVSANGAHVVSIGLALSGLGVAPLAIDFLPDQLKGWIEFKRKNAILAVQVALVAAMLLLITQVGDRMMGLWAVQAGEMAQRINEARPQSERYEKAKTQRDLLTQMATTLLRSNGAISIWGLDRDYVFTRLKMLQEVRPSDVYYGEVNIGPNGEMMIIGYCEQESSAGRLRKALIERKDEVEQASLLLPPVPDTAVRRWRFHLQVQIKGKVSKIYLTPTPFGGPWGPGAAPGVPGAVPGMAPPGGVGRAEYES